MGEKYQVVVITVSDRVSTGVYEDKTGPAVATFLVERGYEIVETRVVPDERADIETVLKDAVEKNVALALTCGGTGFSPRDVTPEATEAVCERRVPGLPEAMRAGSAKITDRAWLSRATAGIRGRTLIVNLPGSPRAAVENLEAVAGPLSHGLDILRGGTATCAR